MLRNEEKGIFVAFVVLFSKQTFIGNFFLLNNPNLTYHFPWWYFQPGWPDRCVSVRKITSHVMVTMRTFLMVRSEFRNEASSPLRLKSPMGQFLGRLQQSHPHLFSVAVEQQLENLSEEARKSSGNPRNAESSSILYK
jgi:hypothetical protein